ncbi:twitching motility protein PilT [Betaproteobacteria bacterium]|nr:twitching motility protein PilT [Betaproteobacteria bacterium]
MTDRVFFDTNILVYAFASNDDPRCRVASGLIEAHDSVVVSVQVLNEFYAVMTGKQKIPHRDVARYVQSLIDNFSVVSLRAETVKLALKLKPACAFSWWDSLILASALESGASFLFTEDMQNGQWIENRLHIVNPFSLVSDS